ncbi:MAG TPA: LysM peptidoglycan-binding domain-containing protein [Xanthomonadales bacterium]|nr:LysM peptidoglycan-binding domain-containing protein [Xanthomonadales bacterium]
MSVAVFAADGDLRNDHPDTYVVQKGDTLWDIAGRFLNHPWLWPEIWQANPQVQNPHLIYPGDVLSLVYLDGRPIVSVQEGGFGPRIRREEREAINTIPLGEVEPFLEKVCILGEDEANSLPYVLAIEEDRLRGSEGQLVYVRGLDAPVGTRVVILRPQSVFYDVPDNFPWDSEPKHVERYDWHNERGHTLTGFWDNIAVNHWKHRKSEYLGHEAYEIAQGEVLRGGDPTTVLVQYGDQEVKESDLVVVGGIEPFDLTFMPRPPAQVPENMRVVALADALHAVGRHQVIALSKGGRDGVENGQVFSIFRPGAVVRDDTAFADDDLRTVFSDDKAHVQLPEEYVGHVMIFRTFEKMSYGLVMDGIRPVYLYDTLHEPVR